MNEQASSAYAPPIADVRPYRAPTPRLHWLGVLGACSLAIFGPGLVVDGRLGLPIFNGAEGVFMLLAYLGYCVVLAAFAVFGMLFVAGRRIPAAVLAGLAMLPAGAGVLGALRVIAANGQLEDATPEVQSDMLGFLARLAYPIASFGLAASGCALIVVVVLSAIAHRAALAHRSLDRQEGSTGRAIGALVAGSCVGVVTLFLHHNSDNPRAIAVGATCVLAAVAAGVLAHRIHLLALVDDERERGRLWRRAALLPVAAALAVACFEGSLFFNGFDALGAAPIVSTLILAATTAPLLLAPSPRRAALRTIGVPFAATSAVVGVSLVLLVVGGGRIVTARAEGTDHAAPDVWRKKAATDPDWPF